MKASRLASTKLCLPSQAQCGVDVARALFGGGLVGPVAAAHVLEPARGETVDHQRDIAPVLQKLGHARVVLTPTPPQPWKIATAGAGCGDAGR